MRFQVEVPDDVYGKLAALAEKRGCRITDLLAEPLVTVIKTTLRGPRKHTRITPAMAERMRELHSLGRSWPEIAADVGVHHVTANRWGAREGLTTRRQEVQKRNGENA